MNFEYIIRLAAVVTNILNTALNKLATVDHDTGVRKDKCIHCSGTKSDQCIVLTVDTVTNRDHTSRAKHDLIGVIAGFAKEIQRSNTQTSYVEEVVSNSTSNLKVNVG